jgi:hypothetical protein
MVVVDKLTKATHFIIVKVTHKAANIAEIYIREIAWLHGVPKEIVSNQDPMFTYNFLRGFFNGFGTNLNFSTTYHPDSYWQTKRINQIIEDMLRMYVIKKPSKWEDYIHLVEFAYNHRYQESLKMILFEALYGKKFSTQVSWDNPTDRPVIGLELLEEMEEHMVKIKQNLKVSQDRKKSYPDRKRT